MSGPPESIEIDSAPVAVPARWRSIRVGALRPAAWWLISLALTLRPMGDRRGADPPFGRPWYVGQGLSVLAVFVGWLALTALIDRVDPSARRWRRCAEATLFLACFLAFVSNFGVLTSDDNLPNRALPLAIAEGDGFDLAHVLSPELEQHYSILHRGNRSLSAFPLGTALLATPYYGAVREFRSYPIPVVLADGRFEKHAATLLTCLAVTLLFAATFPLFGLPIALTLALGVALATPVYSNLAQGLWSQTGELAAFAIALALLSEARRTRRVAWALGGGIAMGYAVFCRPTALLLLPLAWVWLGASKVGRRVMLLGLALAGLAIVGLNRHLYGSILGGYGQLNRGSFELLGWAFFERLGQVLASPSRGLVVFFPALAFASFRLRSVPPSRLPRAFRGAAIATLLALVLTTAAYVKWWGGHSMGPRLLAEGAVPAMLLVAAVVASDRRRWSRAIAALLVLFQIVIQVTLTRSPAAIAWSRTVNVDHDPDALRSWRNSLLAAAFVPGWHYLEPGPYLHDTIVSLDAAHRLVVDLAPAANRRYDVEREEWHDAVPGSPYLPRLAALPALARTAASFRFLPPGANNMVRVCTGETSRAVTVPDQAIDRIFTVIAWREPRIQRPMGALASGRPLVGGTLVVVAPSGARRRFRLRVNHEIFDSTYRDWARYPDEDRYVAGRAGDVDALILQELTVRGRVRRFHELYLQGPVGYPQGCLYLFAVSLRTVSPARPLSGR